jgi:PAS domain S-box-containing protein
MLLPEASQTILVVNDDPDHLDLMRVLLVKAGYRVLTAPDGREGVHLASTLNPELVISDVNMPVLDGIELCRRLRAEPGTRLLPIMLVSAERVGSASAVEGLRAGADDYLEAPYDPVRMVAKVTRLLERKQGEEVLRASEERYRLLFENNPFPMWVYDAETLRFLDVNDAAVRQYGYSRPELLGMTIKEIRPPEEVPTLLDAVRGRGRYLNVSSIWTHRKKDGTVFDAEVTTHAIHFGGRPAVIALAADVTERRRAEERLRHSERQLAEAQRLARIGNWEWDIRTNKVVWSDGLYRVFGLEPQEFGATYEAFLERLHPDDRQEVMGIIEGALERPGPFIHYHRVILPGGSVRILHNRGEVSVGEDGRPVRMFGTEQDVTERRQAEEQLGRSNEQLRALSVRLQAVREEASIRIAREIHDELGSALTGLKMDLSWINKRLSGEGRTAVQQKLQSALELIDETVVKVRNISTELRPSVLDDLGLAAAIEWQAREFEKRTEIRCEIVSLHEDITFSPEKSTAVFRIFQEVLTNVSRHAHASRVEVRMTGRGGDLLLKVSDNGRGIDEGKVAEATSLGLLGMRERAMIFGGQVEVTGAEGRGTTVTVRIPLG